LTEFSPVRRIDGYPPIEDHGLIGDCSTAALVARNGAVSWLSVPRFDSPPLFCRLLDDRLGGSFTISPDDLVESRQRYTPDTGVLITEMRGRSGVVQITDALTLRSEADLSEDAPAGRGELLRVVDVKHGQQSLNVELSFTGEAQVFPQAGGLGIRRDGLELHLASTAPLGGLRSKVEAREGERTIFLLRWGSAPHRYHRLNAEELLHSTVQAWHRWLGSYHFDGPEEPLVRRSAITLKMLDYAPNGAIVAAPTSSLPEAIGGPRNWDYRYTWIRDAAFSVYALRRIGLVHEARSFLGWVLDAVEKHGRPRVLYNLDGEVPPPEREDPDLEGYRQSPPVRWGNAAAHQMQHDVYGEILDCAYQWGSTGGDIDPQLWACLRELVEAAGREWRTPDHGIWEVRTPGRLFTYSAALCQVALDRGARIAERFRLPGDARAWSDEAERLRQVILKESWDEEAGSLTEHLGGGGLDASLLSLPLRRVILADHPRMVRTTEAIQRRLGPGQGLLFRYLPDESPDGLPGHEGAFLLCSFWLVDNLAKQGRLDEALDLFGSLCARANALGLLPEQIDPGTGAFLGNFPQAFSHVGLISSAVNLARLIRS
jgi:GH15 family glucan-1,4-alpha-glucosidase